MTDKNFIFGADLSLAKRIVDAGGVYRQKGEPRQLLELLEESGIDCARLRLFHQPTGNGAQVNDLEYTLDLAQRLKDKGFDIYLAPHFSDGWADPGKQYPPRSWEGLDFPELVDAVHGYSRDVMKAFKSRDLVPKIVQVGNEITPGMLWEYGRVAGGHGQSSIQWSKEELNCAGRKQWVRLGELLKASISGIEEALGSESTDIMLHIDRGGDSETSRWFFENIAEQGVPYDTIGLSYYPFWHGMPDQLRDNAVQMIERFGKDVYLAEMAYPYKEHAFYEEGLCESRELWRQIMETYPLKPEGQQRFVEDVSRIMMDLPGGRGRGAFYWAPEWIPLNGFQDESDAETCWVRALFDDRGNALPALESFRALALEQKKRQGAHASKLVSSQLDGINRFSSEA